MFLYFRANVEICLTPPDLASLISFINPVPGFGGMIWLGLFVCLFTHMKSKILQYIGDRQIRSMQDRGLTEVDRIDKDIPRIRNGGEGGHPQCSFKFVFRQIRMRKDRVQYESDLFFGITKFFISVECCVHSTDRSHIR